MFTFFESEEKKEIKTHLRHLVRLAQSDGVLHKDELKFIYRIGKQNGLSTKAIDKVVENPTAVDIVLPKTRTGKFDQIFDLVQMMMKDGEVNDAETEFCMELASRLGFRKVIVGVLVAKIERGITNGMSKKEIRTEAEPFINY